MAECLFCRIANRQLPAAVVGEAEGVLAFNDINPQAPIHILIIPADHIPTLADITPAHAPLLGRMIGLANDLARQHRLADSGYRVVMNCGAGAGQSVWHLHLHLLGGRRFTWPPG
ncbi:MAG: histidine triad nucleotide-binding protein [Candidatus Omnitrophica bacterium]|nr:histidine triad nucleotide-binding protein [Candidatus Omnitrophota bacterium]